MRLIVLSAALTVRAIARGKEGSLAVPGDSSVSVELAKAFEALLDLQAAKADPCALERSAISTDKPVYRPGETVFASVYNFNVANKRPSTCRTHRNSSLHVFDAMNGFVGAFAAAKGLGEFGQSFTFLLAAELPGGLYRLRQPVGGDEAVIYVLRFTPHRAILTAEWNRQTAHVGDTLSARLCLRSLGQVPLSIPSIAYSVQSDYLPMYQATLRTIDNCVNIKFLVERDFTNSIVFLAQTQLGAALFSYKKEFFEPELARIILEFAFETGRPFTGINVVFFRAWSGRELQLEMPVTSARVLRKTAAKEEVLVNGLTSRDEGRGSFELSLVDGDFGAAQTFLFEMDLDSGVSSRFVVAHGRNLKASPVGMRVNDRVVSRGRELEASFVGSAQGTLVLQDKATLLFAQDVDTSSDDTVEVPLRRLPGAERGGVFTLQFFMRVEGKLEAQQELEVFVEPQGYVGARVDMPLRVRAGELLSFGLSLSSTCSRCADVRGDSVFGLAEVVDDSSAAEVARELHSPPLITKVFLQSEVHSRERFFFNSLKYVERLFNADAKLMTSDFAPRIALLLGVQSYRRFLFTPQRLAAYLAAPGRLEVFPYRHSFLSIIPLSARLFAAAGKVLEEGYRPALLGMSLNGGPPPRQPSVTPDQPFTAAETLEPDLVFCAGFFAANAGKKWAVKLPNRAGQFTVRATLFSEKGFYGNVEQSFELRKELALSADVPISLYLGERLSLPITLTNAALRPMDVLLPEPATIPFQKSLTHTISLGTAELPKLFSVREKDSAVSAELRITTALLEPGLVHRLATAGLLAAGAAQGTIAAQPAPVAWLGRKARLCATSTALQALLDVLARVETECTGRAEGEAVHVLLTAAVLRTLNATQTKGAEEQKKALTRLHTTRLEDHVSLLMTYRAPESGFRDYPDPAAPARTPLTALAMWALSESGISAAATMTQLAALIANTTSDKKPSVDVPSTLGSVVFAAFVAARTALLNKTVHAKLLAAVDASYSLATKPDYPSDPVSLGLLALYFAEVKDKEKAQALVKRFPAPGANLSLAVNALMLFAGLRAGDKGQKARLPPLLADLHGNSPDLQALLWSGLALAELFPATPQSAKDLGLSVQVGALPAAQLQIRASELLTPCTAFTALPVAKDSSPAVQVKPQGPLPHDVLLVLEVQGTVERPPVAAEAKMLVQTAKTEKPTVWRYAVTVRNISKKPLSPLVYEVQRPSCFAFRLDELDAMRRSGQVTRYELRQAESVLRMFFGGLPVMEEMQFVFSMERRFAVTPCTERPHLIFASDARAQTLMVVEPQL